MEGLEDMSGRFPFGGPQFPSNPCPRLIQLNENVLNKFKKLSNEVQKFSVLPYILKIF